MKPRLVTNVVLNNLEMSYAEDLNSPDSFRPKPKYIFFVENFRRKDRKQLSSKIIPEVQKEIKYWLNKHQETEVVHIFQFKKNTKKTDNEIESAIKCQVVEGAKVICLYEHNPKQDYKMYGLSLTDLIKLAGNIKKFMVFEIEANDIVEKIQIALKNEIKSFIFIGGDYDNEDLWINKVVNKIHKEDGKVGILFPARMHKITKKSYLRKGIEYGADFVFHGKRGGGKINKVLFLDVNDLIYKDINEIADDSLQKEVKILTKEKIYKLSRIYAINNGNIFAKTYAVNKVIQT